MNTASETFLEQKAIFGNQIVGFVKLRDCRFVWANDAFARMFGYAREELVGVSVRVICADDQEYQAFGGSLYAGLKTGDIFKAETQYVRKNGQSGWFECSGGLLSPGSTESVWTFLEITKQKLYEFALTHRAGQLRDAQRLPDKGAWEYDLETRSFSWSEDVFRIYDIDERYPSPGRAMFLAAVHPEDRSSTETAVREAVMHRSHLQLTHRVRSLNGEFKYVHVLGDICCAADGTPQRFAGTAQDVTESVLQQMALKENENRLLAAANVVECANRARSEFLANMSHEFRTPLNGVLGNAQLLEMSDLGGKEKKYLSEIMLCGNQLLSLINDVLDVSKVEAEKLVLENGEFSISGCFKKVAQGQHSCVKRKGLSLRVWISAEVPDLLTGDALRVKQILLNILLNAIKFTDTGGIILSAALRERCGDKVLIELVVTDTGIGIAAKHMEDIFKPFVQADTSMTRRYGGSGLGLTISRQLAELMGGSISVESSEGHGSTFRVLLPLRVAESAAL